MDFLEKISLKQSTLYALTGSIIGLIVMIFEMLDRFSLNTLVAVISQGTITIFFQRLYSKQKGEQ